MVKTIPTLIFLSVIFMYINFIGINVETLPIFLFLVYILFITTESIEVKKLFINKKDIDILLLIFIILGYGVVNFIIGGLSSLISTGKYLLGPLCYFMFRKYTITLPKKTYFFILFFVFLLTVSVLMNIGIVISILQKTIARLNLRGGFRGISVITPEPSYFAFYSMLFIVLLEFYEESKIITRNQKIICLSVIIFLTLLSLSVYSLLVLLTYIFVKIIFKNPLLLIGFFFIFFLLIYFPKILPNNRIKQIFTALNLLMTGGTSLMNFLFFVETSGSTRFILNFIAIMSIFFIPFGSGFNSFGTTLVDVGHKLNLPVESHEVIKNWIGSTVYAQTYFANLANDIGILSLVYLVVFFTNYKRCYTLKFRTIVFFFLLLTTFFQSQITNPIPWIILALVKTDNSMLINRKSQ